MSDSLLLFLSGISLIRTGTQKTTHTTNYISHLKYSYPGWMLEGFPRLQGKPALFVFICSYSHQRLIRSTNQKGNSHQRAQRVALLFLFLYRRQSSSSKHHFKSASLIFCKNWAQDGFLLWLQLYLSRKQLKRVYRIFWKILQKKLYALKHHVISHDCDQKQSQ